MSSLCDTLIFFLIMIQWQLFRLVNNIVRKEYNLAKDYVPRIVSTTVFHASEMCVIITLCRSINRTLSAAKEYIDTLNNRSDDSMSRAGTLFEYQETP